MGCKMHNYFIIEYVSSHTNINACSVSLESQVSHCKFTCFSSVLFSISHNSSFIILHFSAKQDVQVQEFDFLSIYMYESFFQAKYNVLSGNYPISTNDALVLGGILAYIENGTFDPEEHTPSVFK